MKRLLCAALAAAMTTGAALAADLPSRKDPPMAPPPPPPPMWTGFYLGLNAGGTWTSGGAGYATNWAVGEPGETNALLRGSLPGSAASGFMGGGQVGYNWQLNSFVVGIEADMQGVAGNSGAINSVDAAIDAFTGDPYVTISNRSARLDYLGTVRGRLGWLFAPTLLVYGAGGLAYGGVSGSATSLMSSLVTDSGVGGGLVFADTRVGWTAGGGLEWMFWPNWSAKVEYLRYDLGSIRSSASFIEPGGTWGQASSVRQRFDGNLVRAGLNYHFN
jgi:outer membrane immunogenic protein